MNPDAVWYGRHWLAIPLLPVSWLYCAIVGLRRLAYRRGWFHSHRLPVPVVVVGNLTVGGTGKTPLVLWLAEVLRGMGRSPGIVLRGYGGRSQVWPRMVAPRGDPSQFGDEAVLLARRAGCPVAAGPDRTAAARLLLERGDCDLILCDDGLQHYRLQRDLEILVIDAERGFGNGRCLPAGPLREPSSRQRQVALRVCNGGPCEVGTVMRLKPGPLVKLGDPRRRRPLADFRGQRVTAVAAVGNPGRFFALLRGQGLLVDERPYRDHHQFTRADAASWPPGPVLMTEKDAVKCEHFAGADHWYLPVDAELDAGFAGRLSETLKGLLDG